ncbi:DUF3261 domain-containing protein [Pelagibius marinus]|uniref:DUF3261 domain-containing protein n=1 Tax=Pelagibius marinus TaxID=2762760 RepID=UPI001872CDAD|nr:DUF3261 domain-containing protein [Pelagibius marinus]
MRAPLILLLLLATASCAQHRTGVAVGPLLREPLPVEGLGEPLSLSQVVTSIYQEKTHSIRVETEVSPGKLVMVGVSHIGIPLFEAALEGGELDFRALGEAELPFDPRYILSDFQLAYWPFGEVKRVLAQRRYKLEHGEGEGDRLVFDEKTTLIVRVHHEQGEGEGADLLIEHYDLPYRLQIKTLKREGSAW